MRPERLIRLICALLLSSGAAGVLPGPDAYAQGAKQSQLQPSMSPQQAADKARKKHGGKVLKVTRKGNGYRVKLLKDSGHVVTVTVKD
jgi:hypothetical protein